jgi:hypothetical protein
MCTQIPLATSYPCTDAGVFAEFQKFSLNAQPVVEQYESQGYKLDQCGEMNGSPIATYVLAGGTPDAPSVQFEKLCVTGSTLCD